MVSIPKVGLQAQGTDEPTPRGHAQPAPSHPTDMPGFACAATGWSQTDSRSRFQPGARGTGELIPCGLCMSLGMAYSQPSRPPCLGLCVHSHWAELDTQTARPEGTSTQAKGADHPHPFLSYSEGIPMGTSIPGHKAVSSHWPGGLTANLEKLANGKRLEGAHSARNGPDCYLLGFLENLQIEKEELAGPFNI